MGRTARRGPQLKKADPEFPLQLDAGVNMGEATTMQGYYMALLGTGESVVDEDANGCEFHGAAPGIPDLLVLDSVSRTTLQNLTNDDITLLEG